MKDKNKNTLLIILGLALIIAVAYNLFFVHIDTKEEINCITDLAETSCEGNLDKLEIVPDSPTKSIYVCDGVQKKFNETKLMDCIEKGRY